MEQEKIIDIVRKLRAKALGGTTEGEAKILFAKADELMAKYHLSEDDLLEAEQPSSRYSSSTVYEDTSQSHEDLLKEREEIP